MRYIPVNHPFKLKLTIGQRNKLKSFMKNTGNKKEYRRLLAILQKAQGRTYEDIANEHGTAAGLYRDGLPLISKVG